MTISQSQISSPAGLDSTFIAATLGGLAECRLELYDDVTLQLVPYNGQAIYINGARVLVTITSTFTAITGFLLNSNGSYTGSVPVANTIYWAYAADDGDYGGQAGVCLMALSDVAPEQLDTGVWYLSSSTGGRNWRLVGVVCTTFATRFEDTETFRGVISYYNQVQRRLFACPNYNDGNSDTTYTLNSATWTGVASGNGVSYLAIGPTAQAVSANVTVNVLGAAAAQFGIGFKQNPSVALGLDPIVSARIPALVAGAVCLSAAVTGPGDVVGAIVNNLTLVGVTGAIAATIVADFARNGAPADPYGTYLEAFVPC